tara:strand:- start:13 stop:501 length:489 start_codon:yes stop_codon:yes gene_type:complete
MSSYFNIGKKLVSGIGSAINKTKTNVPKTKLDKAKRDLDLAIQKNKASKAKLNQTIFEMKNNKDLTFKKNNKKSESNTEAYKRIQKDNTKVIKGMIDKAVEKKADGGRIGRKFGSKPKTNVQKIKETFGPKKPGNVPSKFKGFSKLPEAVQQKINKKLAKKV